jgi:hypothetical protein
VRLIHLSGHRLIIPSAWSIWLWRGWRYQVRDGALWARGRAGWRKMAGVTIGAREPAQGHGQAGAEG